MNTLILGLHLLTAHSAPGYESQTPGIYVRHESGATAGLYRNSIGRNSAYAGWTFETEDKRYALTAGVVSGYQRKCVQSEPFKTPQSPTGWGTLTACAGHTPGKIGPLLVPSVKIGQARLALVSYRKAAVHLAYEWEL